MPGPAADLSRVTTFGPSNWSHSAFNAENSNVLDYLNELLDGNLDRAKTVTADRTVQGDHINSVSKHRALGLVRGLRVEYVHKDSVRVVASKIAMNDGTTVLNDVNLVGRILDSGIGGLDEASALIQTWYSLWVVHNPVTQESGLIFSLSTEQPLRPSGYTLYRKVGWVVTNYETIPGIVPFTYLPNSGLFRIYASHSNDTHLLWESTLASGNINETIDFSGLIYPGAEHIWAKVEAEDITSNTLYVMPAGADIPLTPPSTSKALEPHIALGREFRDGVLVPLKDGLARLYTPLGLSGTQQFRIYTLGFYFKP
jgi:hypothetical protein